MGGIAFVFSGQGDQHPGMGQELCNRYPVAAEMFRLFDRLRPGTSAQCFTGTAEELRETKNAQPCLFAMELAAAAVLLDHGIRPEAAAGFSLGELAAAAMAGVFSAAEGFSLVCRRAGLMQAEAEKTQTSMAAVLGLTPEQVGAICAKHDRLYPVNFNCPGQITVSGPVSELPALCQAVKDAGGRALPLKVGGAFHSPFMRPAAAAFGEELKKLELRTPEIPLYSDVTALPYGDPASLLAEQIASPVRWEALIRNMIAAGIDTFLEVGPGKTLCNMIRKTDPAVRTFCVSEMDRLIEEVLSC